MTVKIRARLLTMYPLSILQGGLELQCLKTCAALQRQGVLAELLDYHRSDDQFDVLHLFGSTENFHDLCRQAAGKWPIVVSAVSGAPDAAWWRKPIWDMASNLIAKVKLHSNYSSLRTVYQLASSIICLNRLEADFLKSTYDVSVEKIEIVSNGVDDENFGANGELFARHFGLRDFVLFTGNIVQRKNPVQLARALKQLNYPGVFIGRALAAEKNYAEEFASIVDRSVNLRWIQGLSHNDPLLMSAYAAAGVFCLPSTSETQSLSALEAMACKTPVILGDFPYSYQSPFENCVRCVPSDVDSIKVSIEKVLGDPDIFRSSLPDSYRWSNVAEKIINIYQRILTEHDRSRQK